MPGPTLDETGFHAQTMAEITTEIDASLRDPANFGPDFVLDETEVIPTFRRILAEREAAIQAKIAAGLAAMRRGQATGVAQDDLAAFFGLTRQAATYSTVPMQLNGVAGQTIPSGRVARHTPTQTLWETTGAVLLNGSGVGTATMRAQTTGPINITASTSWTIVLGDPNLTSVQSTGTSTPGRNAETSEELDERIEGEAGGLGEATPGAISANLKESLPLLSVYAVIINASESYDSSGQPPGSVQVVLDDGGAYTDQQIAEAVFARVGAGTQTWGTTSVVITDSAGQNRTIRYSRPTLLDLYLRIDVSTSGAEFALPSDAATLIAAAAVAYGNTLKHGQNPMGAAFISSILASVPALTISDVDVYVGPSSNPSTPSAVVQPYQLPRFDVTRTTVTVTA